MGGEEEPVAQDAAALATPAMALRARTLEILWHCNERNDEAETLGLQGSLIEGITSIDYNPHHNRLVTTGGDGRIRLWQLNPAAVASWLDNSANDMTACSTHICAMRTEWMPIAARWSPQGEMIASVHCDGKVCLWWREGGTSAVMASSNVGNGNNTSTSGGCISQSETWKDYRHLSGHISDVYDVCFSPDSQYLLTAGGDGTVVIHDLEGSTLPVVQLTQAHAKFCRGVAWDPWGRFVSTFGAGPSLQYLTHVPKSGPHRRMHLAEQRRCQGDFIGESCAFSFRRLSWSPDGVLLAVPYGKLPRPTPAGVSETSWQGSADGGGGGGAGGDTSLNKPCPRSALPGEGDVIHCVNLYARGALDRLAGRLAVRGYNEVRGVQWAPCFLPPLSDSGITAAPHPKEERHEEMGSSVREQAEAADGEGSMSCTATNEAPRATVCRVSESWGPVDYRMALAVWTSDAVLVYTTDGGNRHSDFTDLHMRSITDVAWSHDAAYLYTASLDGYVSVIGFGDSLAPTSRLPIFSARPTTRAIIHILQQQDEHGHRLEDERSSKVMKAMAAAQSSVSVATVRKKRKLNDDRSVTTSSVSGAASDVVDLQQLAALMQ